MSPFTDRLRGLFSAHYSRQEEEELPWNPIHKPSNADTLLEMLMEMYWDGVYREVKHIMLSVVELQKVGFSEIEKDRQEQGKVVGFDAFIDQICEQPSRNNGGYVNRDLQFQEGGPHQPIHPLRTRAPRNGDALKEATTKTLQEPDNHKGEDAFHFRARSMLQAAGFLDIDKLVEYRKPDETFHTVRKGKVPQLQVDSFQENGMLNLSPVRCKFCRDIVRGVLFKCDRLKCEDSPLLGPKDYFCEDCFHNGKHPQNHLVKIHKHCILDSSITVDLSQKLCQCTTVPRNDRRTGEVAALYPIDPALKHRRTVDGYPKCRLFLLQGLVAEAKYRQLCDSMESRRGKGRRPVKTIPGSKRPVHEAVFAPEGRLEDHLDTDIPWALKPLVNKFPFGNTHISLMIGPLVIENGALKPYQGVLITQRNPLDYFVQTDVDEDLPKSISVGYGDKDTYRKDDRRIFTQYRTEGRERRLKACMKQVVGGAFSGYFDQTLEDDIVNDLIAFSGFTPKGNEHIMEKVRQGTEAVMGKMKVLLASRILAILERTVGRLFHKSVPIEWDIWTNNCQFFLDAILRYEDFGGIFGNAYHSTRQPLYLMSFVVRIESYDKALVLEKYDVPNGQTEEYLLSFRSGRHDDSDIVDTLHEYWHDWAAFGGPLYKHQDHFPWDCTEAYKESAPTCNDCTLSRHVWAFPFDSWSIIQLALQKNNRWYASPSGTARRLSRTEWLENRFKVLIAQDTLLRGAIAMARTPRLREACDWFRTSTEPRFDRLKLGGIHRAQPWSHHFEAGRFQQPYVAPWAQYTQKYRVHCYESMRLTRQQLKKVPPEEKAAEVEKMSSWRLLGLVEELSVPIAGAAIFIEAAHLPHTAEMGLNGIPDAADAAAAAAEATAEATADIAAAAAEFAVGIQAMHEGVARFAEALGSITG